MTYPYPKISNCLTYRKRDTNIVEITDYITHETYVFRTAEAVYAKKLDGTTNPYSIASELTKEEIDALIAKLKYYGLLKESNRLRDGGTVMQTIWEPRWTFKLRVIAFLWNNLLLISWLPVLVIGITMFMNTPSRLNLDYIWTGFILGLVSGMILHEFGHAFAGAAYGAKVFEMGLLTMYYIMPGAYVILDEKRVKSTLKRVQINAAGVESNVLLTGLFLILGATVRSLNGMFLVAAAMNAFLAILNLTLVKGLDGTAIISELLGVENLVEKATAVVFSKRRKSEIRAHGLSGNATIAVCYMICAFQIAMPIILILNVAEVIVCFI